MIKMNAVSRTLRGSSFGRRPALAASLQIAALSACVPALAHGQDFGQHLHGVAMTTPVGTSAYQSPLFTNNLIHPHAQLVNLPSPAATVTPVKSFINLDLTSSLANVSLSPNIVGLNNPVEIRMGDATKTFTSGSLATPAELVAISQVLQNGKQTLILDDQGRADGGSFSLTSLTAGNRSFSLSDWWCHKMSRLTTTAAAAKTILPWAGTW